jgi:ABC-type glycerol-3-phosphate transport system substrate-binding protein
MRIAAAIMAAAAMLTACASDEPGPSEPTGSQTKTPSGHGSYAHCLSEHGVSAPPGPVVGAPPGVDPQTWQEAMDACATLAPGPAEQPHS